MSDAAASPLKPAPRRDEAGRLQPEPPAAGRSLEWIAALVIGGAALVFAAFHLKAVQFFCDDSYISFRFAQNFAEGHGLVYNPGERVEGYTNFLWVILVGLGLLVGFSAEVWSLVLGVSLLVLTGWMVYRVARTSTGSPAIAAFGPLLLAALGPIVLWAGSGLETICFTVAALVALVQYDRSFDRPRGLFAAGLLYAVSTMVRPDGVIFGAVAGLHLAAAGLSSGVSVPDLVRRGAALAGGYFALMLPFVLWRHSYYDDWLPNTFYVKTGSVTQWRLGSDYLQLFVEEYPALWFLLLVGIGVALLAPRHRARRRLHTHLALAVAGFAVYVIRAGGDYMALFRFVVPMLPPIVVLCTLAIGAGVDGLGRLLPRAGALGVAAALVGGLCVWLYQPTQRSVDGVEVDELLNTQQAMKKNTNKWVASGKALRDALWDDARISTTAAGALPFYSRAWTLDQSGLCDRHIAKVESDPWLLHKPGHQKQATRRYLSSIEPALDIIVHHPFVEPATRMSSRTQFDEYVWRALRVGDGDRYLYLRVHQDRLEDARRAGMVDPETFPAPSNP